MFLCPSVRLALSLTVEFKGVSCFGWYLSVCERWQTDTSDWSIPACHSFHHHGHRSKEAIVAAAEAANGASGNYCHSDTELYLIVRPEAPQLDGFNTLKFQFWAVKPPVLVALTRFSVMERQFLVSLVCCRYVDLLLLIPTLHLQLSLPLYSIGVMYLCSTLHFVSEVVTEANKRRVFISSGRDSQTLAETKSDW